MVHLQIWKELFRCNQMQHLMQVTPIDLHTLFVNKNGHAADDVNSPASFPSLSNEENTALLNV